MVINKGLSFLKSALPNEFKHEAEHHFQSYFEAKLSQMDLVTREEFDIQARVLEKTRAKLEQLQHQLDQLEQQ